MRRSCAFATFALLLATVSESSRLSIAKLAQISQAREVADANAKLKGLAAASSASNIDYDKLKKMMTQGMSLAIALFAAAGDDGEIDFDFALDTLSLQGLKLVATAMDADTKSADMKNVKKAWQAGIELLRSWLEDFKDWGQGQTPNYEHAISSAKTEGWKIVKAMSSDPNAEYMKNAKKAWDRLFGDMNELRKVLRDAIATGDADELVKAILPTIDTGLRTWADALPEKAEGINAVADLIAGLTSSWFNFGEEVEKLREGSSLVQVSGDAGTVTKFINGEKLTQILKVGLSMATSFMDAVTQDPMDLEYLFDNFKTQGWRMATIILPDEYKKGEWIKKMKKAWDRTFSKGADVAEHGINAVKTGDLASILNTVVITVDTGLRAGADVATEDTSGQYLMAVANLWSGVGGSLFQFSLQMGWLKPSEDDVKPDSEDNLG